MLKRSLIPLTTSLTLVGSAFAQVPAPTDIPGLQLWLDATDAGTITTDVGGVSQWDDKSGNGFHATQSNTALRPSVGSGVLLGQNSIRFESSGAADAGSDGLAIDTGLVVSRPYSVIMLDQIWGNDGQRTLQSASGANWLTGRWRGQSGHFADGWVGFTPSVTPVAPADAAFTAVTGTATTNLFRINGSVAPFVTNGPIGNPGNLGLGSSGSFLETSDADIGEIIVVNRALTDSDSKIITQHLVNNWGLPTPYVPNNATRTQTFTGAGANEGLDFSGTFHAAANAGNAAPTGFAIGDATFTSDSTGNVTITAENSLPSYFTSNFTVDDGADDTNLNTLMNSIRWSNSADGGVDTVTTSVTGLTVGNTYKAQMLFGDAATTRHWGITINGDQAAADFQQAAHTGATTNIGVALIHEFVAESTTLDIVFDGASSPGGDRNPIIQGITVEDEGVTVMTTTGTFASASDLDFSGNITHAISFAGPAATVGDANFVSDTTAGILVNNENTNNNWVNPNYGATADDDALETVMKDIRWTATNNEYEELGVQIDGLVADGQYKLQLLWDEQSSLDRSFDVIVDGVLIADDYSTTGSFNNALGSVLTHMFTASGDTLNITLDGWAHQDFGLAGHDSNPTFHALTLELIPEPSSAALLGLGLIGLLARRRR